MLAPATFAFLAIVADDHIPQAIGFGLIMRRDLERERLAVFERIAAVLAKTGVARHGELDRQDVALLVGWVVAGEQCTALTALSRKVAA